MLYTIPTYKSEKLIKLIDKLNRKAKKNSAMPISYTVSPTYQKTFTKYDKVQDKDIDFEVDVIDLTLDIDFFKPVKGFQFLASVEHSPNGNILVSTAPDVSIPDKFRTSSDFCDHCKVNRFRKNTYIVLNENTKDFIQVGSTCIKDYFGIDVDLIARRFEFLRHLENLSDTDHEYWGSGGSGVYTYPLNDFLATALNIIDIDGYVSGKTAYESNWEKQATGSKTIIVLNGPAPMAARDIREWYDTRSNFTDAHKEKSVKIIEWVLAQKTDSDYFYNLSVIAKNQYVTHKTANMATSMIIAYMKAMDELKPRKEYKVSEHIGKIGEKVTVTVEYLNSYTCESAYGRMFVNNFITDDGAKLTWFTTTDDIFDKDVKYIMTAKVKKHQEYKGVKQTIVKLAKFK